MTKNQFNKPAKSAAFNYRSAIAEARDMFPDATAGIVFCDVKSMKPLDPAELSGMTKIYFSFMEKPLEMARDLKTSFCAKMQEDIFFISLYTEKDMANYTGGNLHAVQYHAFDHELAHVIIPLARPPGIVSEYFAECVADAFAVIRHFQRFGLQSQALDQCGATRAAIALFGDSELGSMQHFTSPVVEKIVTMKDSLYLDRLNPQQTIDLAVHMAQSFAIAPKTLDMWQKACAKTTAAMSRGKNSDALYESAQRIMDIQHPLLAKWGYAVLDGILDGTIRTFHSNDHRSHPMPQLADNQREKIVQRLALCKAGYAALCKDAPVFTAAKN